MFEPAVTIKNLLFDNWSITSPARDGNKAETFAPTLVHFTTRYWATNPERIHKYQISVLSGTAKKSPEEVGSIVIYKVEEQVTIHVWAVAGIGDDWETIEYNLRQMLLQIDVILRITASNQATSGLQFIRVSPGDTPQDMVVDRRVFHRIVNATVVYYETDTGLPIGSTKHPFKWNDGTTWDGLGVWS